MSDVSDAYEAKKKYEIPLLEHGASFVAVEKGVLVIGVRDPEVKEWAKKHIPVKMKFVSGFRPLDPLRVSHIVGISEQEDRINLYIESHRVKPHTPDIIDGKPVRKIVTGRFRIGTYNSNIPNRDRVRPVVGGVSVSPPEKIAGTLGIVTEDGMGLTNAHVAAINYFRGKNYPDGTKIYQPGWVDGGRKGDVIGELAIYTNLKNDVTHTVDGATIDLDVSYEEMKILGIGELDGWTIPEPMQKVLKSGRTTGVTESIVVDNNATVKMDGYPWGSVTFEQCIITIPAIAEEGDSGSILVSDGHVAGMVFGGSDAATAACRPDNIIMELGVCFGRRYRNRAEPPELISRVGELIRGVALSLIPAGLIKSRG